MTLIKRIKRKIGDYKDRIYSFLIKRFFAQMDGLIKSPHQLEGTQYITIGKGSILHEGLILTAWDRFRNQTFCPKIGIGRNVRIGEFNQISSCHTILIGDNVLTGRYVYISDNNHGNFEKKELDMPPIERPLSVKGPVIIEDNVWIGEHVCILSGVRIGKGAVIAANAVVTHDVPCYSLVAGVPAKIIKRV